VGMSGIRGAIEKIAKGTAVIGVISGKVTDVQVDTCTVISDHNGREYFNVSFNAIGEQEADRLVMTPKKGSKVILGVFPNGTDAVILSFSEVEKLVFVKGDVEFEADADGYKIDSKGENL